MKLKYSVVLMFLSWMRIKRDRSWFILVVVLVHGLVYGCCFIEENFELFKMQEGEGWGKNLAWSLKYSIV